MKSIQIFTISFSVLLLVFATTGSAGAEEIEASETALAQATSTQVVSDDSDAGVVMPSAKAGECYAKVIIPAKYKSEPYTVTAKEASSRIEVVPAKYEWVEKKLLAKEAYEKLIAIPPTFSDVTEKILVAAVEKIWTKGDQQNASRAISSMVEVAAANGLDLTAADVGDCYVEYHVPAQYKTETQQVLKREASQKIEIIPAKFSLVEERVLVKEASFKLAVVPAIYATVTEQVLVRPATTEWKKGRGPLEIIDNNTGEIMCLVEVPAVYKDVSR